MNAMMGYRGFPGAPNMMDGAPFAHAGLGIAGFLGLMLLAAVVTGFVVWLIMRRPRTAAPHASAPMSGPGLPSAEDSALAIARERLARGEIDPEQYSAIVTALRT